MPESDNPQDGNVGNLGDIFKHSILLQCCRLMPENCLYVETHSYKLVSTTHNQNWDNEVTALVSQYPSYSDYRDIEASYIARDEYLCSSGIARLSLQDPRMVLCESDPQTRAELEAQVVDFKDRVDIHPEYFWLARGFGATKETSGILCLVDPFQISYNDWIGAGFTISKMLTGLYTPGIPVILVLFAYYDFQKSFLPPWDKQVPEGSLTDSVYILDHNPYHISVYSSAGLDLGSLESLGMEKATTRG